MAGKIPSLKETQVSSIAKIIIRKVSAVVDRCIVIAEKVYVLLSTIESFISNLGVVKQCTEFHNTIEAISPETKQVGTAVWTIVAVSTGTA